MAIAKTKEQAIEIANQILTHLGVSELHDTNEKPITGDGYNVYLSYRTFNQNALSISFHVQPSISGYHLNLSIASEIDPDGFRSRKLKPASLQKAIVSIDKVINAHEQFRATKKEAAAQSVAIAAKLKSFTDSLEGMDIEGIERISHHVINNKAFSSVQLAGGNDIRISIEGDVLISKVFKLNIEKQGEDRAIELIKTVRKLELI